jgi:hypothetical protein
MGAAPAVTSPHHIRHMLSGHPWPDLGGVQHAARTVGGAEAAGVAVVVTEGAARERLLRVQSNGTYTTLHASASNPSRRRLACHRPRTHTHRTAFFPHSLLRTRRCSC